MISLFPAFVKCKDLVKCKSFSAESMKRKEKKKKTGKGNAQETNREINISLPATLLLQNPGYSSPHT